MPDPLAKNQNPTLSRALSIPALKDREIPPFMSGNLLDNPSFVSINIPDPPGSWLHADTREHFQRVPGWFQFGATSHGTIARPGGRAENPAFRNTHESGVRIRQYAGQIYGLCQRLRSPVALTNRRVRVAVHYRINSGIDPVADVGVHVYLVSTCPYVDVDRSTSVGAITGCYWSQGGSNPDTVVLRTGAQSLDIGHVVRMTSTSNAYGDGLDWLCPAFDWLDVSPDGTPILCLGAVNDEGEDAGGIGSNGVKQNARIFYLPAALDDRDTATGVLPLLHAHSTEDMTLLTAESWTTIPEEFTSLDGDNVWGDLWIVVLPVAPGQASATVLDSTVTLWSITLEVALDNGAEDHAILTGIARPGGTWAAPVNARDLMQYPIYMPTLYPLSVAMLQSTGANPDFDSNLSRLAMAPPTRNPGFYQESIDFDAIAPIPYIPPPAVIVTANWLLREADHILIESGIYQELSWNPEHDASDAGVDYPGTAVLSPVLLFDDVDTSGAATTDTWQTARALRHRIGFHWPVTSTTGGDFGGDLADPGGLETISTQGTASLYFRVAAEIQGGGVQVAHLQSGAIRALVDPRAPAGFLWRANPTG